jgi:hypothetical protein
MAGTNNERVKTLATTAVLLGLALAAVAPAQGAPTCGDAVVSDWSDGRIEGRYQPHCYGEAIESLPEDVRAYSTAAEDITVALGARIRELRTHKASGDGGSSEAGAGPMPIALLSGAGIALALGLAALARFVTPRLRERLGHRPRRPVSQW